MDDPHNFGSSIYFQVTEKNQLQLSVCHVMSMSTVICLDFFHFNGRLINCNPKHIISVTKNQGPGPSDDCINPDRPILQLFSQVRTGGEFL